MIVKLANPVRESFRLSSATDTAQRPHKLRTRGGVTITRVDPLVWSTALRLACGDALRIEVHDAGSVTVHNTRQRARIAGMTTLFGKSDGRLLVFEP